MNHPWVTLVPLLAVNPRAPRTGGSRRRGLGLALAVLVLVLGLPAPPVVAVAAPSDRGLEPTEPGERPELRTRTSKTVRLDDGRLRTTVYSGPVHYAGEDGAWRPISNRLVASTRGGYALTNEANDFEANFRGEVAEGFVAVAVDGADIQLTMEGAGRSQAKARGNRVGYGEVFPGVDVAYDVASDAVKESLVLHRAQVPVVYRFRLSSAAELRAERVDGGSWAVFAGASPDPVFVLTRPFAVDAAGAGRGSDNAELDVKRSAGGLAVTLSVDAKWLHAPDRQFPVVVDPTVQFAPTATADWNTSCQGCAGYESFDLYVGTTAHDVWRAGAQFDFSAIPPGSEITGATLGLYYDKNCLPISSLVNLGCGSEDHVLDVHAMTSPWTSQTAAKDLRFETPVTASRTLAVTDFPTAQWLEWNVTSLAKAWYSQAKPNHGVLVKRRSETLDKSGPKFPSRLATDASMRPKLTVTYNESVALDEPETLRSNGASLRWSRYAGASGLAFSYYEVHRDSFPGFFPSSNPQNGTLLARINDRDTTTFTDTTAAPNRGFTYKVVVGTAGGTSVSNERTVTLPSLGNAVKRLQPAPAAGQAAHIAVDDSAGTCANFGAATHLHAGGTATGAARGLLRFDLRDIPSDAQVVTSQLSLYHTSVGATQTVRLHAATAGWDEGTGTGACTADGATWYDRAGGAVQWESEGADHVAAAAASVANTAGAAPNWDNFNLAALTQQWVSGTQPNHGMLVKSSDETRGANRSVAYAADDFAANPLLRPKMEVTYVDGNAPTAPTVSMTAPADNTVVRGEVKVRAHAFDDRRVKEVRFYVKNQLVATDTTEPYEVTWNSTTLVNTSCTGDVTSASTRGSLTWETDTGDAAEQCGAPLDQLRATAVDDAGNEGTSDTVNVRVANANAPTSAIRLPLDNSTVKGSVPVTVDTSTDVAKGVRVARVELLQNGAIVASQPGGTATTYQFTWDTLSPDNVAYDGAHQLSARVFDTFGQAVTHAVNVTVDNTTLTKYRAGFASTTMPTEMVYDPDASPHPTQDVSVTVTNNSGGSWPASTTSVVAKWYDAQGKATPDPTARVTLNSSLAAGSSRTVTLKVRPPVLPAGVDRAFHELRVDVEEYVPPGPLDPPDSSGTYVLFAQRGNPPKAQKVETRKMTADRLGLEKYFHYTGEEVGGGMQHLFNVANGNSLLRLTPFSSPGVGLNTVFDITYNSREAKTRSPLGSGFSGSISGLVRLGEPLVIHPKNTGAQYVAFTDGDGTTHTFKAAQRNGKTVWDEPAGVHLYLRKFSSTDPARTWAVTRPDRVTFFFDADGWPTSVRDANGNQLTFTQQSAENAADDPGKPRMQLTRVRDAGGRDYTLSYYTKADNLGAHVRGQLKSVKDHNGSELRFDYYQDGNLLRITQTGARTSASDPNLEVPDRRWTFTYTTSDLSGPAIPNAANRVNPDARTPNQSQILYSVRDPRGRETTFAYVHPPNSQNRGRLDSSTDRAGAKTTYSYDAAAAKTTVTAPEQRATTFAYDTQDKVTSIVNPKNETTTLTWTADKQVEKITEPTGKSTSYTYDANGYLTSQTDQLGNSTVLTYEHVDARNSIDIVGDLDPGDTSQYWKPGRTVPHVSQLKTKTSPEGVATTTVAGDYEYQFGYDTRGNLKTVTEPQAGTPPARAVTTYDYNANGTVKLVTDARGKRAAEYLSYDGNGLPTAVRDALGRTTRFTYDADGLIKTVLDPRHAGDASRTPHAHYRTMFTYDTFHRLARQSTPKSSEHNLGVLIHSGAGYDPNDNITVQHQPSDSAAFTTDDTTTMTYDHMDRLTLVTGPDRNEDPKGERTKFEYDTAGRLTRRTAPKGVDTAPVNDFATSFAYDPLDRVLRETRHHVLADGTVKPSSVTHYCYDLAGDLVSVTAPNAGLASRTCDPAEPRPSHTVVMTYDAAHRITSREDAKLNKTVYEYDRNDNVTAVADPEGKTTRTSHDQRDMPVEVSEPLTASRRVVTRMEYDAVGNLTRTVHPRGYDVAGGTGPFDRFTTTYTYDDADQLVRVNLPSATAAGDSSDKYYVHRRYDANGNLRLTTLPTGVLDTSDDLDAVPAEAKTRITHFDTGWIRTSDENLASGDNDPQPTVQFDYWPEGWQKERTPLKRDGTGRDDEETMTWAYFNDGQLRERKDNDGQASEYKYDANNNLRHALDGGVEGTAVYPRVIRLGHDPLDRVSVSRERERRPDGDTSPKGNFNTTEFGYDLNHNVLTRVENIVEKPDLTRVEDGRTHTFTYEPNDWLASHLDGGKTTAVTDDRRILNEFDKTGRELRRRVQKRTGSDSYTLKQTTEWTWFDNGKLETLKTSTPASGIIEQHTVGYVDNNIYMNGHRVTDTFLRKGPGVTSCASSTCTARYEYDARDRLTKETPGHGPYTTYKLDAAGNVELEETFTAAGAKTKSTTMTYAGNQLQTVKTGSDTPQRHHYDLQGRLECVVLEPQPSTRDICATATNGSLNPRMLAHYRYDYLDRMIRFRSFRSDGVNAPRNDDDSRYVYDALDRVDTQREQHWDPAGALTSARTTAYSYLGLTSMVSTETHTQGVAQTPGAEIRTRSYGYDAFGHRVSMTDDPAGPEAPKDYTYGYDVHGSVSQLVADAGTVSAAYGYKAYGAADPALSGGDTSTDDPVNPYRYTAKRLDSGSGQLDMGARRFTPDTGRFVQRDQYHDALGDLRLGTDPLTGNRYALAAGNPLSFVEADGHAPIPDGGGGSTSSPTTSENDELWGWERTAVATSGTTPTQKRTSASSGGGGTPSGTSDWRRGEQASRRDYQTLQRTQNYAEAGTASGLALHEAGLMTRDRASRAAREMRLGHDALTRSQGAKTLAEYRHSRWGTGISRAWSNPALRGLTRGGAVIGAGASYASNVSEGEDWKVAAAETAAETAGAWGGAKLGFVIGCAAGPVGCFVGAALGGIVGGVATAFAVDQTQEYVRRD